MNRAGVSDVRAGASVAARRLRLALLLLALAAALPALPTPAGAQSSTTVTMTGSHDLHMDNTDAKGIAGDGTIIWIADDDEDKIFAYNKSDMSHNSSFDLHADQQKPQGVAYDATGSRILVMDEDDLNERDWACYYAYTKTGTGTKCAGVINNGNAQAPRGFATWGRTSWVVDGVDDVAYPVDISTDEPSNSPISGMFVSENARPWGGWTDGRTFWVVDTEDTFVYAYQLHNGERDTDKEFDLHSDNDEPRGMWSDGETMYVVDRNGSDKSKVYKYSIGHLVDVPPDAVGTFDYVAAATKAKGIAVTATRFYISDKTTDKVYVYDRSATPARQTSEEFDLQSANDDTFGVWTDGTHLWVLENNSTTVYAYRLSDRTYQSGENLSLNTDNGKGSSLWNTGGTWWVVDRDDDKVYGYPGGTHNVDLDFDLTDGNGDAVGSWSDGVTAWVADPVDDHIYAYCVDEYCGESSSYGDRRPKKDIRVDTRNLRADSITSDGNQLYVLELNAQTVYIYDIDTAPQQSAGLEDQVALGGEAFSYQIASDTFVALDGDTLAYTAHLLDPMDDESFVPFPAWLTFTAATRTFASTGVPVAERGNTFRMLVTVSDELDTLLDEFEIRVNTPPHVHSEIPDREAPIGSLWTYAVPLNIFLDDDDETHDPWAQTLSATDGAGNALPTWLSFFPETRVFEGTPAQNDQGILMVKVTASDGYESASDTFALAVGNVAPSFPGSTATRSVAENTAAGQNIGDPVAATDLNTGDTLTYTLGGTDAGHFHIVGSSGQLQAKGALNYESSDKSYTVTVSVRDSKDDEGNADTVDDDTTTVTINVTDVPEAPTISGPANRNYAENGTGAVGTYTVTDPDTPLANVIFQMLATLDADDFEFSSAGVLTFKNPPDYEAPTDSDPDNLYEVTLFANDQHADTSAQALDIDITVTNVDEPPTITGPSSRNYAENGTGAVGTYTADDPENSASLIWALGGADVGQFDVSVGGVLTFVNPPDYENEQDTGGDNVYNVNVVIVDGSHRVSHPVTVTVTNVNEPPTITGDAAVSVEEGSTTVGSYTAADPESGTLTWSALAGTDAADFSFSSGALTFSTAPNFEDAHDDNTDNTYLVTLGVSDGTHTTNQAVTVTVTNKDEEGTVSLPSQPQAESAYTATLSDPDGTTSSVTWQWQGPPGTDLSGNGANTATYTPQASDVGNTLRAVASYTDPHGSGKSAQADSTNTVKAAPVVNTAPTFPGTETGARSVDENTAAAENIGSPVAATDPQNDTLTYTIGGTDAAHFDIVGSSGQLQTKGALNHEGKETYTVTVTATDPGNLNATKTVTITVNDVNEPPTITGNTTPSVAEGTTEVGTYSITDPDDGQSPFTYNIIGVDGDDFDLSSNTVVFINAPDYENAQDQDSRNDYEIIVLGSDGQTNPLTAELAVTVTVTNVNEPPTVTGDTAVSVAEGTTTTVASYTADDPENATITWGLAGTDAGDFSIDTSGNLEFTSTPDFEDAQDSGTNNVYNVTVQAAAGGHTTGHAVTVTVTNVEEPGEVTFSSLQPQVGTAFTATLSDPDGATSSVTWQWQGPPGTDLSGNGANTATYTPQASDENNTLRAIASYTDPEGSGKSAGANSANPVQPPPPMNQPPEFPSTETGARSVEENTASAQPIGTAVAATDPDSDTLTYSLDSAGDAFFDIDSGTGQLQTEVALDHESRSSYRVTVTAADPSGLRDTQQVTITVTNVDEPPDVTGPAAVSFGQGGTGVVATYQANDPERATIAWTLTGDDAAAFTITGGASGQLRFVTPPDFDAPGDNDGDNAYEVTVTATDPTRLDDSLQVVVTVTERRAPPPVVGPFFAGGPTGPEPSEADFEWTVTHDLDALDEAHTSPTGMWSDGGTLWLADNAEGAGDAVYAYDLASGARVEEREFDLDAQNRAPRGVWSDGATMWVSDSGRDRLFAYDLASGERLADRDLELVKRNRDARGVWGGGEVLWVLDGGKDSLFAYDLASGEFRVEYELVDANSDPRGIWSDGVTVWVSDHAAKRLFAYRLPAPETAVEDEEEGPGEETGNARPERPALQRVRAEDFTELSKASNLSPRGIWSNGAVMYVADASDGKVYTYNMPDAMDARLASLALEGVEIGEFDPDQTAYEGVAAEGVTQTTVTAGAQPGATVAVEPADADEEAEGHQVDLAGIEEVTVTVTSADGSRTEVYRVALPEPEPEPEPGPSASCLRGDVAAGFSLVVFEGGSVDDLAACAEGRAVAALYALHEGAWVSYILGAPEIVNAPFRALFADGVPALTPFTARSDGPPSPDPGAAAPAEPWTECLRGEVAAGFSLVLYQGGSVEELAACAESRHVSAVYALAGGEWVSYILGAPGFVNAPFAELYADGVPVATPLVVRSDGPPEAGADGEDATEDGEDAPENGEDAPENGDDASENGDDASENGDDASENGDDTSENGDDASENGDDTSENGDDASEN